MPNNRIPLPHVLKRLAADLERYAEGHQPAPYELAAAPLLEDWRVGGRVNMALHGITFDHPILTGMHHLTTSELYFLDAEHGWARTFNRIYRLGTARADRLK